ncbi:Uncharacterized protein dnl_41050 [Desulfonema limicola]|uniref:Uncharacterized protein n=1 Tax=Desulfonema limicola TaxID=45656 RepID=A0A975BAG7_9BACT|nr:hypothetical protein [Desulfonema limicola]QTA81756.1 Uncharacterized protein dnl_41050 [Desulfonema limicola]
MSEFSKGFLVYKTGMKDVSGIPGLVDFAEWDDGYIGFSKQEIRLKNADISKISYTDKIEGKGFVTEIDLWRKNGETWEELVLEREDNGFYMQHWELKKITTEKSYNCYWRNAKTFPRKLVGKPSIFEKNNLHSLEVVCHEKRLHFFITAGEV